MQGVQNIQLNEIQGYSAYDNRCILVVNYYKL